MKKINLLLIIMFFTHCANAQIKMGLRAAYSLVSSQLDSKQLLDIENARLYNLDYMSNENCTSLGIVFYSDLGQGFLMAEILYRRNVINYELETIHRFRRVAENYTDTKTSFSIPIAGGVKFNNFKIGAGPIFNVMMDSEYLIDDMEGFESRERNIGMGFQFMLGIELNKHLHLDFKREINFSSVGDNYYFLGREVDIKSNPHMTTISLGIFL